jgi:general stress protein YciG
MPSNEGVPLKRGFAAMSKEKQREIAKMGGHASHGGGRPRAADAQGGR